MDHKPDSGEVLRSIRDLIRGSRDRITESRDLLMRLELDERMRTDRGEGSAAIARRLAGKRAQHV
jgi:hypothetical protein